MNRNTVTEDPDPSSALAVLDALVGDMAGALQVGGNDDGNLADCLARLRSVRALFGRDAARLTEVWELADVLDGEAAAYPDWPGADALRSSAARIRAALALDMTNPANGPTEGEAPGAA